MYEVYTMGGGIYLVDIFNTVAAISGGSAFANLIRVVAVFSVLWLLFQTAFGGSWMANIKWYTAFLLIYLGMFSPRATVHVTDRLNPTLAAATISNVPFGLAAFASMTSEIGDGLTRLSEATFSLPDDLRYQKTGMLFGARLVKDMSKWHISDSQYAGNMSRFMRQCVFYGILLGHIDPGEIARSTDLWDFLGDTAAGEIRHFEYRTKRATGGRKRDIVSCQAGYALLATQWPQEINKATTSLGKRLFPRMPEAAARNELLSRLPIAHSYLIGASSSAAAIMKQQMIINAFDDSVIGWTQETGNAAAMQGYMKARSDMQTSAVYRTTGIQAEKWVPILRIVFEALYYGAFPLALLMMLTPLGFTVVRGYFSGFIWLQSWGPLYAVLHRIMMGEVALKSTSLSGGEGVAMFSQVGINAIVQDASAMAGYLSMSVPFIAIGVMFGANRFASLATSMLAPTQRASGTAAEEGTSGNINLGNTGQDNHNFSNTAGFSMRTNALIDHGMVSSRNEDGSMYHRGAAGNESVFKDLAISDPGFNAAFGSRVSQSLQERSAESSSHAVTQAERASESIGASMGESLAFSNTLQNSEGFNSSQGKEQREAVVDSASNIRQAAQRLSEGTNWSEQQSLRALAAASIEKEFGLLEGKGGGEWSMSGTSRENWDKTQTVAEEFGVRKSFEKLHSTSQNMQFSEGQSNLHDLRDSMNASYNEGQSAEKSLGESLTRVQSYEKTMNTLEEDNGSFNANLNQTALEIGAEQFGGNVNEAYLAAKGNPLLAENWADDAVQNYINNLPVEDKTPGSLMGDIHGSRGADAGLLNEMNRDGVAAGGTPDNNIDEKREEMNEAAKRRSQLMQNNSQEINDRYSHANRTTGETVEDRSDDGVIDGLGQNISDGYEAVKGLFDSDDKKPEENK